MNKYVIAKMGDEFKPKDKGGTFFDAVRDALGACRVQDYRANRSFDK